MSSNLTKVISGRAAKEAEPGRMSGDERRRQLIDVAIHLFSQKGFRGTTTKEIALAAQVNEAIIFRHFATKEDLYTAILDHKASEVRVDEWIADLKACADRNDDEALFRLLASRILEHHRRDREFLRLMLYSALEGHELSRNFLENQVRPINNFLYDFVGRRQSEGAFRGVKPMAVVRSFIGMMIHHVLVTRLFRFDAAKISDEEAVTSFTRLFLDGLRAVPTPESGPKK